MKTLFAQVFALLLVSSLSYGAMEKPFKKGMRALSNGNDDVAITEFGKVIAEQPGNAEAYEKRGEAYADDEEYDNAIADFNEAIKRRANYADAYVGLGEAYTEKEDPARAMDYYNQAIQLDSKNSDAYSGRGDLLAAQKDYTRARSDYEEAIRLEPDDDDSLASAAWLLATCPDARERSGAKALEYATKACQLAEWKDADHLSTLAAAYAETGNFDLAVQWINKAIALLDKDDTSDAADYKTQLTSYQSRQPYRDTGG